MSNMVEKVARAINDALVPRFGAQNWQAIDENARNSFREQARAAIEAMREPTEEMLQAGTNAVDDGETYSCRAKAEGAYYDMLSAALSPKGE